MESTSKYWIPVSNNLESYCIIVLAYPKFVKSIRGKKTDKKYAKWIANIFKHDIFSESLIPPRNIRQLRDLVHCHKELTGYTMGERNYGQCCLTISNFKLYSAFSDFFGKASSNVFVTYLKIHQNIF